MKISPLIKKVITGTSLLNVYFLLFIAYLIHRLIGESKSIFAKESWELSEWLINYQGGFVRRGLRGEIIF